MTTIGRVDFTVDFDGKKLPAKAREIGTLAGQNLSRGMEAEVDRSMGAIAKRMEQKLIPEGAKIGKEFANSLEGALRSRRTSIASTLASLVSDRTVFDAFVKNSGNVSEGLDRVTESLRKARDMGVVNGEQFRSLSLTFSNWGGTLLESERNMDAFNAKLDETEDGLNRVDVASKKTNRSFRGLRKSSGGLFGNLDGETKLIVALLIAAANDVSVLGSAAGSGLTLIGLALGAATLAAGVFAIGLNGVTGELKNIAEAARPAIVAFRGLGDDFRALQQNVQGALFTGLEDSINNLAGTLLPSLDAGLTGIATVLNSNLLVALNGLGSAEGVTKLDTILTGLAPVIDQLVQGVIGLVGALGNITIAALPFLDDFASKLNELIAQFNAWTGSIAGQQALTEWFQNGATVMEAVLPLLGAIGTMFNALVTPETIQALVTTLGNLEGFMPALGAILGVIGDLDPIGLVAQALNEIGEALKPTIPFLSEFATIVGDALSQGLSTLIPMLGRVVAAFAPLLPLIAQAASDLLDALVPALEPLADALVQLATDGMPAAVAEFQTLIPAVVALVAAMGPLLADILPPLIDLSVRLSEAMGPIWPLINEIIAALIPYMGLLGDLLATILPPLIDLFILMNTSAIAPLAEVLSIVLIPAMEASTETLKAFQPAIEGLMTALGGLMTFINSVFAGDWESAWNAIGDVFTGMWEGLVGTVKGVINAIVANINSVIKSINKASKAIADATGADAPSIPTLPALARGALVTRPMRALVGEAGPEAVVPLNRPLSQVDPRVRELSAIAQGKSLSSASTSSRTSTIEAGAIVVYEAGNGEQTASAIFDRFVAEAG